MATLSTVAVDFIANTGKYVQGLSQMSNTTKKWANDTKKQTDSATTGFGDLSKNVSGLSSAFKGLGVGAVITGLVALTKQLVDAAGRLADLSDQVKIGTQSLQRLESIFEKNGVAIEEVVAIYSKLEKSAQDASDGNVNLIKSFSELGIGVDYFNNLSPEQKLEAFAKGLDKIEDPARRAALSLEIAGKSSRKALAGFEEIAQKGSIAKATEDIFVNSEEAIKALDNLGDGFSRGTKEAQRYAIQGLGTIVNFLKNIADKVESETLPLWTRLLAALKKIGIDSPSETFGRPPLQDIIIPEEEAARQAKAADQLVQARNKINDIFLSSIDPAAKYRVELKKLEDEAKKLGISDDILAIRKAALKKEFEDATKKIEENRRALELNAQSEERARKAKFGLIQTGPGGTSEFAPPAILPTVFTPGQQAQLDLAEKRLKDIITFPTSPEAIAAQVAQEKRIKLFSDEYNEIKRVSVGFIESTRTAQESYDVQVALINKAASTVDEYGNALISAEVQSRALKKANEDLWAATNPEIIKAFDAISGFADQFARAIAEGQNFGDALKGVFKNILRDIQVLILRTLILKAIMASIGLATGGINSEAAQSFGRLTGLIPKADGGPVMSGKSYLVGEEGAEMFIPKSNGTIIPNDFQGAGEQINVVQNINIQTGVAQTVRAEMLNLLPRFKQDAMAGVLDAKQRGGSYAKGLAA